MSQFTVNEEQFVLRGGDECDELVFTVEAETDVGSSGTSPNTNGGFPKGKMATSNSCKSHAAFNFLGMTNESTSLEVHLVSTKDLQIIIMVNFNIMYCTTRYKLFD